MSIQTLRVCDKSNVGGHPCLGRFLTECAIWREDCCSDHASTNITVDVGYIVDSDVTQLAYAMKGICTDCRFHLAQLHRHPELRAALQPLLATMIETIRATLASKALGPEPEPKP